VQGVHETVLKRILPGASATGPELKTTIELSTADLQTDFFPWLVTDASKTLKSLLIGWLKSRGIAIDAAATFETDASGAVTIVSTNAPESGAGPIVVPFKPSAQAPIVSPLATSTPIVSPIPPISVIYPGHMVTVDPPLSVTGTATMFGLNWDKSPDKTDNGIGFFTDLLTGKPYLTRDPLLVGCSLPREVMLSTFLGVETWRTAGVDNEWNARAAQVRLYVTANTPLLTIDSGGLSIQNVPLVDAGPSADTGNALDLTYRVAHELKTDGEAIATYMILVKGKPIQILGWDFAKGRVG
jgi:hypothetical protein